MLGNVNFTCLLVVSGDGPDLLFTDVGVLGNIVRWKYCSKVNNNPLNFFRDGFTLRHSGCGCGCGEG